MNVKYKYLFFIAHATNSINIHNQLKLNRIKHEYLLNIFTGGKNSPENGRGGQTLRDSGNRAFCGDDGALPFSP